MHFWYFYIGGICSGACASTCTFDGRKWSVTAGSGGRTASVLDSNLLCNGADPYGHNFNVLLHEFTHTVHGYGLDSTMKTRVCCAKNSICRAIVIVASNFSCRCTLCDKVCQRLAASRWFTPGGLVSSTNKQITEILLKVAWWGVLQWVR